MVGNDILHGDYGRDIVYGGDGDDVLSDFDGGEMYGDDGHDTITVNQDLRIGYSNDSFIIDCDQRASMTSSWPMPQNEKFLAQSAQFFSGAGRTGVKPEENRWCGGRPG
jgi:hypothetical protein